MEPEGGTPQSPWKMHHCNLSRPFFAKRGFELKAFARLFF